MGKRPSTAVQAGIRHPVSSGFFIVKLPSALGIAYNLATIGPGVHPPYNTRKGKAGGAFL